MEGKLYFVYILSNKSGTLYTGVTNNLSRRIWEHKTKMVRGFTAKYNIDKLVYYVAVESVYEAIAEEKRIKGLTRKKKMSIIKTMNPGFVDLSIELAF